MPPRPQPKIYQVLLKTHKLTIFLSVPPSTSIASLKRDALSALRSDVCPEEAVVGGVDRFALCRFVKGRGEYVVLDESKEVGGTLANWERVFVRFRDGDGKFLPVEYTPMTDDVPADEGLSARAASASISGEGLSPAALGKRKARPE